MNMYTKEGSMLIEKASNFAKAKHVTQLDDAGKSAFLHPQSVARLLSDVTEDANLIAAGFLHDTLEDTETTYKELVIEFGQDVADLVNEVTKEQVNHFPRLKTQRGMMLKFADRLHNLSRMETWDQKKRSKYMLKSIFWRSDK